MFQLNLDISHFLETYWQKKPTVIKQGFRHFVDPITPDEIAGLAMEEEIESRLVFRDTQQQWQAECGPFETFERLDADGATLLIQAVDNWHEDAQQLVRPFRFLPNWRIDDLMISYSTPEGGVGPHIDNYDVFIIQGLGKRHWRVGKQEKLDEFAAHGALKHCEAFEAVIDVELEPGDILYIPNGCPHEGYAIEPSLNYSVGFRAPDQNDLFSSFADYLIDNNPKAERYTDISMHRREKSGQIESQELAELHRVMLASCAEPEQLIPWLGRMLSDAKHDLDLAPPDIPYTHTDVIEAVNNGAQFVRLGGLRAMYFEHDSSLIFINGKQYDVSKCIKFAQSLCDQDEVSNQMLDLLTHSNDVMNLFIKLVNSGYWYER
ncbi:ribosomal protein uL16 3-hydroxylase [Vibrio sp. RC27]